MMACYQSLRARRPDLAGAVVLINISDELKRANRLDQEERFYRERSPAQPGSDRSPALSSWPRGGATPPG